MPGSASSPPERTSTGGRSAPNPLPSGTRTYTMRQRQASIDETRARILDAAVSLYETVGPAGTTMSAAAAGAGITRSTLYRHFPTDADLANAVIDEWLKGAPTAIDDAALLATPDDAARIRPALAGLYAGYRATAALTANLLRDARTVPATRQADLRAAARSVRASVSRAGFPDPGSASSEAALGHATAFETWRTLSDEGLDDAAITDLMVGFVMLAGESAGLRPAPRSKVAPRARDKDGGKDADNATKKDKDRGRDKDKGKGRDKRAGKTRDERKRKDRESGHA